jgi:exosortase A
MTMNQASDPLMSTTTSSGPGGFRHLPLLALAGVLSVIAAYWPSIAEMARIWETSDTYAHGYLIAPISLYILYTQRHRLAAVPQSLWPWALIPIVGAGALWSLASLGDIQVIQQLAVVTLIIATVLFLMGPAWCRVAMFPLGFLYLAVPMGDGLVTPMIDLTADFVVAALRATGIPVYRDGTFFVIPSGSWSVVSGCSGMRYLMATITVGVLFAYLNYRSFWRQLTFVVIAVLVSIFANWLRAYGIVMIAHLSNMKLALGVDHYIYGWVFFGIIIFLLMMIGGIWSDRAREPTAPASIAPAAAIPSRVLAPAVLALLLALHLWPLATRALVAAAPPAVLSQAALESAFGADALPAPALQWAPRYAGEPAIFNGGLPTADAGGGWHVAWFPAQHQGAELINAANQLIGEKYDSWRKQAHAVRTTGVGAVPQVLETVLRSRSSDAAIVVWQWYWVGGAATINSLDVKLLGVRSQLRGAGNAGASVLIYKQVQDDRGQDAARDWLAQTLGRVAPAVHAAFAGVQGR